MADLSVLRLRVQRFISDCPGFVIDTALNDAARKFCDETLVWKADVPIALITDQSVYAIDPVSLPTGSDATQIVKVKLDVDTDPLSKGNDENLPIGLGKPCAYFCTTPNELRVGPTPDQTYDGIMTVVLKPSVDKLGVPAFLLSTSGQHLAHGAVYELKMQQNEKWYDPEGAQWHKQQFEDEITRIQSAASKGFASANISVSPRRFI